MRRALPDEPHRFRLGLSRGSIASFFGVRVEDADVLGERRVILDSAERAQATEGARPLVDEAIRVLRAHGVLDATWHASGATTRALDALGRTLAPDLLFLDRAATGDARLSASVVCFPSSWDPETKLGRTLPAIHAPVPELEPTIGEAIRRFLDGLRPGHAFFRSGFGVAATDARDQHPAHHPPKLDDGPLERIFVRVEDQAFVRLPETGGTLFGIRVRHARLEALDLETLRGLAHALSTMPPQLAEYKGFGASQGAILSRVRERLARAAADTSNP